MREVHTRSVSAGHGRFNDGEKADEVVHDFSHRQYSVARREPY
jgi:hypothetical protein